MQYLRSIGRVGVVGSLLVASAAPARAGTGAAPILGGERTSPGDYPTTVAIEVAGGLCSATLLTPEWVLTAAHCVSPEVLHRSQAQITASVRVHFGTVDVRAAPGTVVAARETIAHPTFTLDGLGAHDIGLIRLATPVTDVTPVPINLVAGRAPVGIALTMVGFGATAAGGGGSVGVEYVVAQTSVTCGDAEGDANLLCFDQTSGRGKCMGDSGGPSFAMIDGQQVQVGITSFGDQNCTEFGADTRTEAERDFLLAHVPELQCADDGTCGAGCGLAALPIDPDCPACEVDDDCPGSRVCFDHLCMAAPFAPTGLGSECTGGDQCETGQCAGKGDQTLCVLSCAPGEAGSCPDGFDCAAAAGGAGACWPADGGGCCDAGHRGAPTAGLAALVLGLALSRRRRRR